MDNNTFAHTQLVKSPPHLVLTHFVIEQVEQPKPEDVECMCKLLATVGGLLDSSTKTVKNFGGGSKPVATKVGGAAGYHTLHSWVVVANCLLGLA